MHFLLWLVRGRGLEPLYVSLGQASTLLAYANLSFGLEVVPPGPAETPHRTKRMTERMSFSSAPP